MLLTWTVNRLDKTQEDMRIGKKLFELPLFYIAAIGGCKWGLLYGVFVEQNRQECPTSMISRMKEGVPKDNQILLLQKKLEESDREEDFAKELAESEKEEDFKVVWLPWHWVVYKTITPMLNIKYGYWDVQITYLYLLKNILYVHITSGIFIFDGICTRCPRV